MRKFTIFLCAMLFMTIGYSQGLETFSGLTLTGSSYSNGSFVGQDGSTWEFNQARGDQEINGKAITLHRNQTPAASVKSGMLQGGIGTLQFSYKQAFSTSVSLEVYVNNNLVYTATSSSEQGVVKTTSLIPVNVAGNFELKFVNPSQNDSGQVTIDDVVWTSYQDSSPLDYCIPAGIDPLKFISNFSTTGGVQNVSNLASGYSPNGYGDFTATQTIEQIVGQTVNFTSSVEGGSAGFRIWVDWNQDGVFDTVNEVAYASSGYLVNHSGSFVVPMTAVAGTTRMRIVSHYLQSAGLVDPCKDDFTYGEFEDYEFVVTPLDSCAGTPNGGTVSISSAIGNPNSNYTLTSTGYTIATGMSYQWQSNTAGAGWVNQGAATSEYANFVATASNEEGVVTEWRLMVTCANSQETSYSNIVTFTTEVNYCIPSATNSSRYISNFSTTGGIQNISNLTSGFSSNGYGDFSATQTVEQLASETVNFSATIVGGTAGFRIWVDWNQDGNFDAVEEVAFASTSYNSTHSGSFVVPANALPGETRMRIVSNWSSSAGATAPCATGYTLGEFEDYKFIVTSLEDCSGTPVGGNAVVAPQSGNTGSAYTVSASGFTLGLGLTYQWQSNTNNEGWVDQGSAEDSYSMYAATAPAEFGDTVEWRLKITCISSQETAYSGTASFTTEITYCLPTISSVEAMTRVIFNDLDNSSSATSTLSYEDFTAKEANVEAGTSYEIKLEGNTAGNYTNSFTVWVDWNQNGVFDTNEKYEVGSISNSTGIDGKQAVADIDVPADALSGPTRMRVIKSFGSSFPAAPCGTYTYGQAEDYTVIVEGEDVEPLEYCIPEGTNAQRFINNFTATGDQQSISNLNSGFSAGGYGDFFDTHTVQQIINQDVEFTANISGGTAGFRIWVDWNQDGVFDVNEEVVYNSTTYSNTPTGSFTVPSTAALGTTRMRVVSHWLSTTGDISPCATGFTYGEFEDYKFVVSPMLDCSGTPEGGTLTITPVMGQPGSTYIISSTGYTIANGMTYQWQSNDGSGWVDQGSLLTEYADHQATAPAEMDAEVDWRLKVTCANSQETAYSDIVTFTTGYCTPQGVDASRYINDFETTGGSQNISNLNSGFSPGGYGDFYNTHTLQQIQGEEVNFTSNVVGGTFGFRIWVDWNQDGIFDATEEVAYASTSYSATPSGSFVIPTTALLGETRMRIVAHYLSSTGSVLPCATGFTNGEFEDYKLIVSPMEDCSGTPEGGTITVTPGSGNGGSTYVVSSSGYTIANEMTYQWQSNTNGEGWINEGAATSTYMNHTATAPSELGAQVEWRLEVTCNVSEESAYSDVGTFNTVLTYCNPSISTVEPITRVVFADIDNTSSANSTVKIEDFTAIEANVEIGETYDVALEGNTKGNFKNYFTVWIDWNQNGTFEANEMYPIGMIENSTGTDGKQATGEITIPDDALQGSTRMRVIKNFSTSPTNPCGTYSFGQVEDYTVNIGGGTGAYTCADQNVPSNDFESSVLLDQRLAVDVMVGNDGFSVFGVELNILTNGNTDLDFNVTFLEDNNGLPGGLVDTANTSIHSSEMVGSIFGFDVYTYTLKFETPIALTANTRYWMEVDSDGFGWETSSSNVFESSFAYASEGGNNWALQAGQDLVYALVCEELSVKDLNSFNFAYYPNPVKDVLNIQSQKEVKFVEVFNLTGQRVFSLNKVLDGQINVSTLTSGTYLFRVTLEDGKVETFKILKK